MWFGKGKDNVAPPTWYETGSSRLWSSHYTDYIILAPESCCVWNLKKYSSTNFRMLQFYTGWLVEYNSDKLDCHYLTLEGGGDWNPKWWLKGNRNKSVVGLEALHSTGKHSGTELCQMVCGEHAPQTSPNGTFFVGNCWAQFMWVKYWTLIFQRMFSLSPWGISVCQCKPFI